VAGWSNHWRIFSPICQFKKDWFLSAPQIRSKSQSTSFQCLKKAYVCTLLFTLSGVEPTIFLFWVNIHNHSATPQGHFVSIFLNKWSLCTIGNRQIAFPFFFVFNCLCRTLHWNKSIFQSLEKTRPNVRADI
jgi:hypothetical protein